MFRELLFVSHRVGPVGSIGRSLENAFTSSATTRLANRTSTPTTAQNSRTFWLKFSITLQTPFVQGNLVLNEDVF